MDLLSKELQKIFCPHLILPIFQLAEVIASEVLECRSLSDLYHLRFVSFIYFKQKKLNGVDHPLIFHQVTRHCDLLFYIYHSFLFILIYFYAF